MKLLIPTLALAILMAPCAFADDAQPAESLEVEDAIKRVEDTQKELEALQAEGATRADDPYYFYELGNVYVDLSRHEEAIASYRKAIELKPDLIQALVNLGAVLNEVGKMDESIELLTRAIELSPDDVKGYVNLGDAYYSQGQYYEAMQQFRQALRVDPGAYEAHHRIAVAFADAQIYREAIREWKKVIEIAPDSDAAKAAQENIEVVEQILARRM